jgi:hypothetical protein
MNVDAKTAATSYFFSELTRDYPETKRLCPLRKSRGDLKKERRATIFASTNRNRSKII